MAPPLTLPSEDSPRPGGYKRLAITSPAPEETIRDNRGIVKVSVQVSPSLVTDKGHQVQLLLDGQARGEPSPDLRQTFKGVERGEHTVAAQVLDRNDQVLMTSEPVVFYLKSASAVYIPPRKEGDPPGERGVVRQSSETWPPPTPPNYESTRGDLVPVLPSEASPPPTPPNYKSTGPDQAERWYHRRVETPPKPPQGPQAPLTAPHRDSLPFRKYKRPEPIKPTTPAP